MKTAKELPSDLRTRFTQIRLLLLDVDGVLTDGQIYLDDRGVETKSFSTRDGLSLWWVRKFGLATGVISGRQSQCTLARCLDLQMDEIHLGKLRKLPVFEEILSRRGLSPQEVAFIGDDVIDLPILSRVGLSAAPADAHPEILKRVDLKLEKPGGHGAVRHFLDLWMEITGKWERGIEDILHGNI